MISVGKLESNSCWRKWLGLVGLRKGLSLDQCWFCIRPKISDLKDGSESGKEEVLKLGFRLASLALVFNCDVCSSIPCEACGGPFPFSISILSLNSAAAQDE